MNGITGVFCKGHSYLDEIENVHSDIGKHLGDIVISMLCIATQLFYKCLSDIYFLGSCFS
jgi:hypothetical protein